MVTRLGDQLIYDNLKMGFAKNESDPEAIYIVMTDQDNEEVHLFPIAVTKFDQWVNLGKQTVAGKKVEIASPMDMPRGPAGV